MALLHITQGTMAVSGTLLFLVTMLCLTLLAKKRIDTFGPPDINPKLKKTWIMIGIAVALGFPAGIAVADELTEVLHAHVHPVAAAFPDIISLKR